jgi:hypothetical protein
MWSANLGAFAVHQGMEGVGPPVDQVDHLLPCPFPADSAKVGDAFMRVVAGLLVDAGDLQIGHCEFAFRWGRRRN